MNWKKALTIWCMTLILGLSASLVAVSQQNASSSQQQQDKQQNQNPPSSQGQQPSQQNSQQQKSGGFFGGLKEITGQSSQQQELTATAGSKSVGEGQKIANVTPTAADYVAVSRMESYSIPQSDLKKFQDDGHLQPRK